MWTVCLPSLGEVFAREERETEGGGVAKFVFTDFRRLDLIWGDFCQVHMKGL
jgi:hypothetical protein